MYFFKIENVLQEFNKSYHNFDKKSSRKIPPHCAFSTTTTCCDFPFKKYTFFEKDGEAGWEE